MVKAKTRVVRIGNKLVDVLIGISTKNKIKFVDAADLVADVFINKTKNRKIIQNIRREIEF